MKPSLNPFDYFDKVARYVPALGSRLGFLKLKVKYRLYGLDVLQFGDSLEVVLPWPSYFSPEDLETLNIAPGVSVTKPRSIDDKVFVAMDFVRSKAEEMSEQYNLDLFVDKACFKNRRCVMYVSLNKKNSDKNKKFKNSFYIPFL